MKIQQTALADIWMQHLRHHECDIIRTFEATNHLNKIKIAGESHKY